MTAQTFGFALVLLGAVLTVGKLVRVRSRVAQRLFLPSSIIAGGVALLLGPDVLGGLASRLGFDGLAEGGLFGPDVLEVWSDLPGLLISIVFATLFLGTRIPKPREAAKLGGPQLALGVTMGAGQYVIGLLLAIVVLGPVFGLPPMAGALIEVGFEGGHGTAAGLGDTFEELGFAEGQDLALGIATVGVVSGIVVGMMVINWGVRRGYTTQLDEAAAMPEDERRGLITEPDREPGSTMTVRPSSIEPFAFHFGVIAIAILLGQALLSALQWIEAQLWADSIELFAYVPLFPLAMLGGVAVQVALSRFDRHHLVDRDTMARLQGFALDLLIVSALATLSLQVLADNLVPFLLLAGAGLAWNLGVFFLLARRMLPEFWFERGIGDLGQSLGVTATGLILMRVTDPDQRTPAFEAFGYKQLGFEPFFGGGLVTAAAIPLIAQFGPYPALVVMAVLTVGAIAVGVLHYGRKDPDPEVVARGERAPRDGDAPAAI